MIEFCAEALKFMVADNKLFFKTELSVFRDIYQIFNFIINALAQAIGFQQLADGGKPAQPLPQGQNVFRLGFTHTGKLLQLSRSGSVEIQPGIFRTVDLRTGKRDLTGGNTASAALQNSMPQQQAAAAQSDTRHKGQHNSKQHKPIFSFHHHTSFTEILPERG